MVHGAQMLQASPAHLILSQAAMHKFDVWTSDVELACLQSTEILEGLVFFKERAKVFELDPSECLELLRPLYGLCDAGEIWHESLNQHPVQDLHLVPIKIDLRCTLRSVKRY